MRERRDFSERSDQRDALTFHRPQDMETLKWEK